MRLLQPELTEVAEKFKNFVIFVFVYILEAHAADEWPVKELPQEIPQHKSVDDRIESASRFFVDYPMHDCFTLAVDNEHNDFVNLYCSWPLRYWIINNEKVVEKCMPDGDKLSLAALIYWLESQNFS